MFEFGELLQYFHDAVELWFCCAIEYKIYTNVFISKCNRYLNLSSSNGVYTFVIFIYILLMS